MLVSTRFCRGLGLTIFVAIAMVLGTLLGSSHHASAHIPHQGLDFSIGVDTNGDAVPDCGTGVGQAAKCTAALGSVLHAKVYLNSLGGVQYGGFDVRVDYMGVGSKNNPDPHPWPQCVFPATNFGFPNEIDVGCAVGVAPAPDSSSYTGLIVTLDFNCTQSGTISLVHGGPTTFGAELAASADLQFHSEGDGLRETLAVNCPASIGGVGRDVQHGDSTPYVWSLYALGGFALVALVSLGWTASRRRIR